MTTPKLIKLLREILPRLVAYDRQDVQNPSLKTWGFEIGQTVYYSRRAERSRYIGSGTIIDFNSDRQMVILSIWEDMNPPEREYFHVTEIYNTIEDMVEARTLK